MQSRGHRSLPRIRYQLKKCCTLRVTSYEFEAELAGLLLNPQPATRNTLLRFRLSSPLGYAITITRRDVRAAEGARLEIVCTGNRTQGSNPCLSARNECYVLSVMC